MASGPGSQWLIESPTVFHLRVTRPSEILRMILQYPCEFPSVSKTKSFDTGHLLSDAKRHDSLTFYNHVKVQNNILKVDIWYTHIEYLLFSLPELVSRQMQCSILVVVKKTLSNTTVNAIETIETKLADIAVSVNLFFIYF